MQEFNLKHTQLPKRKESDSITPKDQLIYLSIRRDMDKDTMISKTSVKTLENRTGASAPTIRTSIRILEKEGYLTIVPNGRSHYYKFNKNKQFEPFSDEFLDNSKLTFLEKSILIASQQFMFICDNEGTTQYSNRELSEKINASRQTVDRCMHSLERKNYLTISYSPQDSKQVKIFHLKEFGQAIVSALRDHEDRIKDNTDRIEALEKRVEKLTNIIEDKNIKISIQNQEIKRLKELSREEKIITL